MSRCILAGIDDPGNGARRAIRGQMGELGGYAPGKNAIPYPANTGILLREEAKFLSRCTTRQTARQ